jgi:hypothetical protein
MILVEVGNDPNRIVYNPNTLILNEEGDLATGQKFDNLPPDNKIEVLEVGC